MNALSPCLLLVLTSVVDNVSSDMRCNKRIRNSDLRPATLDHHKLTGRWYKWMDTTSSTPHSTYLDSILLRNGTSIKTLHEWLPDSRECRIKTVIHNPVSFTTSAAETSVMFQVSRMATNETLGMVTVLYFCDDPMEGILIMLRQKLSGELAYLVYTRKKDPIPLYHGVRTALQALSLNPKDFKIKSRDYGCEQKGKRRIKL
ncbi:uncharacterized protein LOC125672102 [Ostrea edulis]|uniref:uncharacterized protein LOC125672102 n=1 Tax=Ostrea edulis TaxID=37623 RepID=UPI0024AF6ABF|nr:uncharacterized protein LOC125672102 [Ostrea edulis]